MPTAYHSPSGSRRLLSRMRQTSACESLFQPADLFFQLAFLASLTLKKRVSVHIHTFEHPCLRLLELLCALLGCRFTVRIGQRPVATARLPIARTLCLRQNTRPHSQLDVCTRELTLKRLHDWHDRCVRLCAGMRGSLEPMRLPQNIKRLHALPADGGCAVPCCIATSLWATRGVR